ncbi:MAG TPA: family 43 glycosylhydrolase [Puia sp.]|nr:family 43 glycosylhydrolase [Puia sp.]
MKKIVVVFFSIFLVGHTVLAGGGAAKWVPATGARGVGGEPVAGTPGNKWYVGSRAPLLPERFVRLPVTAFVPGGWLRRQLELQRDGLMGNLGSISIWLQKKDNAWLNKEGTGKIGWEELPYWLKGYSSTAYLLKDKKMIKETKFWIDAVLNNQRANGDFGPARVNKGNRDLWTNMPMVWCLQSYYEYSGDKRVISFLKRYFSYQLSIPDDQFLKDYWENSRGGDDMYSVYWLYNRTGDAFLMDLAAKIHRNTANWRQARNLPNWHNVNIAQSFREPATYYLQSHDSSDLGATYNDFALVREFYGQVPGGMFGADENARRGYDDPRQAVETCGMVEQITSDNFLLAETGDIKWADNCEDVAFNTLPAAFMPDYRSLRYLTAPNMVISDSKNHAPGISNEGPFLMMNPFSSRCCQHNHGAGWAYYASNTWMATPDNGLVAQLYSEGTVRARVGDGKLVSVEEKTHYPFEERIEMTVKTSSSSAVAWPMYLRVPAWCSAPEVSVNGVVVSSSAKDGYIMVSRNWANGDKLVLVLPMRLDVRRWERNKNSVSVDYGPLSFSLLIGEKYEKKGTKETAIGDSGWQDSADASKWPSYEIYPTTPWNYGLELSSGDAAASFVLERRGWPADNNPFVNGAAPVVLHAKGRRIPGWQVDQYGLCGVLPVSPVVSAEPEEALTLVPMGGARLRISSFPVIGDRGAAAGDGGAAVREGAGTPGDGVAGAGMLVNPLLPSGPDPYSFYKDGYYYYTHTVGDHIELWKTKNFADLATAPHKTIFKPGAGKEYSRDVWAPEVMFLEGKWYAYFAADAKNNYGHRLWVLENSSADPFEGEWVMKGRIGDASDKWAIDGDVLKYNGKLYMVWSGWETDVNREQDLYIARLSNPWTVEGPRVRISRPEYPWEKYGDMHTPGEPAHIDVNEGPQFLQHGGDLFVVYSASACWTDTYALGLLRLVQGGDPMDPAAWKKSGKPVFQQSPENGVYGTGHNSFFLSPDGKESWILYHANSNPGEGCGPRRSSRAQPFSWEADGTPDFGQPVRQGVAIPVPSGSNN